MNRVMRRAVVALLPLAMLAGSLATSGPAVGSSAQPPSAGTDVGADVGADVEALLQNDQGIVAAYTLIVPRTATSSQLQARAVIPSGVRCPKLRVTTSTGKRLVRVMSKRVPGVTTGAAFAGVRACEAPLPSNATRAQVGTIRVPPSLPGRIDELAIVGDTGCRITSFAVQDCVEGWPLAENARSIAKARPDAVVMVGDFFYREAACPPADQALCGGSPPPVSGMPFTDTQHSWIADVFIPMAPMFATAPVLILRGNHEACYRGGNGYFLFFDASALGADACAPIGGVAPENIAPSWKIDLATRTGRLRLLVVDSAYGQDAQISPWVEIQEPAYRRAERLAVRGTAASDAWLLTHRPVFALVTDQYSTGPAWTPWTSMDQQASAEGLLDPYQAIVSGHLHIAQAVRTPGYPAQFVVGQGGTALDPATGYAIPPYGPLVDGTGQPISPDFAPYPNATYQWTSVEFGHVIATANGRRDWSFAFRETDGSLIDRCDLEGRAIAC